MYSEILSKLRTKEEARYLESEIDLLLEKLYSSQEGAFEEALNNQIRSWVFQLLKKDLVQKGVDKGDYLNGLKGELAKLKTLELTLAFEPTEANLDKFHQWVRQNLGEKVVLEINFNSAVLGGAIVVFRGEYRDLSLRKRLEKQFDSDREEILRILSP